VVPHSGMYVGPLHIGLQAYKNMHIIVDMDASLNKRISQEHANSRYDRSWPEMLA